jgi:type I restriction enzyme S subunit
MEVMPGYKHTEQGVIPAQWDCVKLGNFISLQRGHDLTWRDRRRGDVPVMGSAGQNGFHNIAIAKGPGVILGRSGASFGQAHYCVQDFWPHNTALYVTDFRGNHPLFVFYFLKSIDFSRHNSGGAQQSLNRNFISPIVVGVPRPSEQRLIAEALSDADELLGGLDRLIGKKRDLKLAAMQQLLTGETRLPSFHGDWKSARFSSLATIVQGQVDPKIEPYRSMLLVGPEHVESGTGKLLGRRSAHEQGAISGKYIFKKGDVVYGKINPYLKKAFLADFDGLCSADMYPLRPNPEVAPGFLLAVILGRDFSTYAESVSVRSGMPKINREEMAGFSTIVPRDFEEQASIAQVFFDMDAEIAALEQRRDKTGALKQAMMQELLTGRTRLVTPEVALA